jgi:hypothetical protein
MRAGGVINDHAVVAQFAVTARHNHRIAELSGNALLPESIVRLNAIKGCTGVKAPGFSRLGAGMEHVWRGEAARLPRYNSF